MAGRQSSRQHRVRWIIRGDAGLGYGGLGGGTDTRPCMASSGRRQTAALLCELTGPNAQGRASTAAYRGMVIVGI